MQRAQNAKDGKRATTSVFLPVEAGRHCVMRLGRMHESAAHKRDLFPTSLSCTPLRRPGPGRLRHPEPHPCGLTLSFAHPSFICSFVQRSRRAKGPGATHAIGHASDYKTKRTDHRTKARYRSQSNIHLHRPCASQQCSLDTSSIIDDSGPRTFTRMHTRARTSTHCPAAPRARVAIRTMCANCDAAPVCARMHTHVHIAHIAHIAHIHTVKHTSEARRCRRT